MTRVGDLFRRDIRRTIEEVVKVDVADDAVVAAEIDEYVVTDRIRTELEAEGVELARVRDRFPIRVDLTASDVREIVGLRVLDKSDAGRRELEALLAPTKERLAANLRLASDRRSDEFAADDFVRLYPLLPYQCSS